MGVAIATQIDIRPGGQPDADVRVSVDRGQLTFVALVVVLFLIGIGALLRTWMRSGREHRSVPAPRPPGGALRLVDCPIQVMRWWASSPQRFGWAVLPVVLHAAALSGIALWTRSEPLVEEAARTLVVVFAAAGAVMTFALHSAAVVLVDLVAVQSGRARRLVELSALAYWTQVVWSLPVTMVLLMVNGGADFRAVIEATRQLWVVWLLGLHAAVLHVVSGLTVPGTLAAAVFLLAVFFGLPWLITAVASSIF